MVRARIAKQFIKTDRLEFQAASSFLPTHTKSGQRVGGAPGRQLSQQAGGPGGVLRLHGGRQLAPSELDFGERLTAPDDTPSLADLVLSKEQQQSITTARKTAFGRGLQGGAVTGALERQIGGLIEKNRVQNFQTAAFKGATFADEAREAIQPFLETMGGLAAAGARNLASFQGNQLSFYDGPDSERGKDITSRLAKPLLEALGAFGQERAATAGLLMGAESGIDVSTLGLSGQEQQLARAVHTFLNPRLTAEQQKEINPRRLTGPARETIRNRHANARLIQNRIEAGQFLSEALQQPQRRLQAAAAELQAGGAITSQLLAQRFQGREGSFDQFERARQLISQAPTQINPGTFRLTSQRV